MRSITILALTLLLTPFAASRVHAQQPDTSSASAQAHGALKTAGRNAKSGVKSVGSSIHHALKTAGNNTKAALKRATGDTVSHPNHKPGGLNKAARDVSKTLKGVGRSAKSSLKHAGSATHKALKNAGNGAKAGLKGDTTRH